MGLPSFSEHDGHTKSEPLRAPVHPGTSIAAWLSAQARGRDRANVRVLDVGCGIGGTVAWLVEEGFDAYGIDVRADYVANGRSYLGPDRLAVLEGGPYPYPDDYFDVVISDQVFEHVDDLRLLAREVARTTKTGGTGLHVFPSKWILREPHFYAPAVHWLPKGALRRNAIRFALRVGRIAPYFNDLSLEDRVEIFTRYSTNETFYRHPGEIRRILEAAGLRVDMREMSRQRVMQKLGNPRLPLAVQRAAAWAYRHTRVMYLTTLKRPSDP